MDRGDAVRMERRKKLAIELVKERASDLGVVLKEIVWDTRPLDDLWSFRVGWQGGFRVIRIDEVLLIDDDTWAAFEGQIRRWFDGQVAPACRKADDGVVDS